MTLHRTLNLTQYSKHNKYRRKLVRSQRFERERATREKEQQEAMLDGASGSGEPTQTKGTTPITEVSDVPSTLLISEQAHR